MTMQIKSTEVPKRLFQRYFRVIWQSSPRLVTIRTFLNLFIGLIPLLILYVFKLLIEAFESGWENANLEEVWLLVGVWFAANIFQALATQINSYYAELHNFELSREIQDKLHKQALVLPYAYYDAYSYHDVFHRAQIDAVVKPQKFLTEVFAFINQATSLIGVAAFLLGLNPYVGVLTFSLGIPSFFVSLYLAKKMDNIRLQLTPLERVGRYIHRVITFKDFAHEVRVFQNGERLSKMFNEYLLKAFLLRKEILLKFLKGLLGVSLFENLMLIGLIIYLILDFEKGVLSIGAFVFYVQALQKGQLSLKNCSKSLVSIYEQKLFLNHLFTFLDLEHKSDSTDQTIERIQSLKFDKVSFTYPEAIHQSLKKVSFELNKGQIIGIVGLNGSGKSTLIKILSGLYRPDEGKILVNDTDLSTISIDSYRNQVSAIFQNFAKYFMSLGFNMGRNENDPDGQRIKSAMKLAGFYETFKTLPNGMDTQLGKEFKGGKEFSGGQWQKIALSRALNYNSSLLLLDEPTSFFDAISEENFFENLKVIAKDKIVILVSHGLNGIKRCDNILVMKDGVIKEEGTHYDLMERKEYYHELFKTIN